MKLLQRGARALPTGGLWLADVLLDTVRQDPAPSAAVLQGIFFQRVAPPAAVRRTLTAPALVIGHRRDPVHPFSDSARSSRSCPTRGCSRPTRSSSCASGRSG